MLADVARTFYDEHDDDFDMLVVWGSDQLTPGNSFYLPVRNDTPGLGYQHVGPEFFDDAPQLGSERLQGIVWMGPDWIENNAQGGAESIFGILAQETAHRWGSTIRFQCPESKSSSGDLLGSPFHWSFLLETGASPLGGNHWEALGHDTFRAVPVDDVLFSPLDLYLMGLVQADEVGPIRLLRNTRSIIDDSPSNISPFGDRVRHTLDLRADVLDISITQVIEVEGVRDAQVGFNALTIRQAWIFLVRESETPSPAALAKLATLQETWSAAFARMTGGRSTLSTALIR